MRVWPGTAILLSVGALAAAGTPQAGSAIVTGRLSGVTQISFGCPGPQREGNPCERWSSFPRARFQVLRLASGAATRTITSGSNGRFTLLLATGRYRLTPLRQTQTTGGTPVTVTIRAGATTWARVRFEGFPRMV